jgi:3-hydroxybutyryl-CoA dehydratase
VTFTIGDRATFSRTVTPELIERFADASGDTNPQHLSDEFSAGTRFGKRIAHGMLTGSFISALIGTKFPGPGCIYMSQTMKFLKPVFIGDTIDVVATVTAYRPEKGILTLETVCSNQAGDNVLTGEAVVLVKDLA